MGLLEFMSKHPMLTFFLACVIGITIVSCIEAIGNSIVCSIQSICKAIGKQ